MGGRYGDFRDWDDIDAWADGIASALTEHGTRSLDRNSESGS
jgi:menaquinone-dependent protoporphyrinogen oxidase